MVTLTISLDDDLYKSLEVQKKTVELITEIERSMEEFTSMLIVIGLISLGRAMTPQNENEMNGFILSLMGEAPAEKVPLLNRLYALMGKRRGIGYSQEAD